MPFNYNRISGEYSSFCGLGRRVPPDEAELSDVNFLACRIRAAIYNADEMRKEPSGQFHKKELSVNKQIPDRNAHSVEGDVAVCEPPVQAVHRSARPTAASRLNDSLLDPTSKKRSLRDAGRWISAVPYGFARDANHKIVEVREQAAVVRRIFHSIARGKSCEGIAGELNQDGIPHIVSAGRKIGEHLAWDDAAVERIAGMHIYAGLLLNSRGEEIPALNVPPLIDSALLHQVFALLAKQRKLRKWHAWKTEKAKRQASLRSAILKFIGSRGGIAQRKEIVQKFRRLPEEITTCLRELRLAGEIVRFQPGWYRLPEVTARPGKMQLKKKDVTKEPARPWREAEDEFVRKRYAEGKTDNEIARGLRRHKGMVLQRRQVLGLTKLSDSAELKALLKKAGSGKHAGKDRSPKPETVRSRPAKKGPGRPPSQAWTPENLALLGQDVDAKIARKLGLSRSSVIKRRRMEGIPPFTSRRPATVADSALAKPRTTVRKKKAVKQEGYQIRITLAQQDRLLELAKMKKINPEKLLKKFFGEWLGAERPAKSRSRKTHRKSKAPK